MATFIVDSHVHLFPASHLPTLAWYEPNSPLGSQHSVDEYRHAASSALKPRETNNTKLLRGFIFLETDRISSVADGQPGSLGWSHALDEVSLLTRIALGEPIPGEGHNAVDRDLCLGIVPWAPVPGGTETLRSYMAKVKERTMTEEVWRKICGVRYLVQDKPAGVMTEPGFIEGLRWLGEQNLAFDLGVDARQGGLGQLREAVEMMDKLGNDSSVVIIINHLCKPNLRLPPSAIPTHAEFLEWKHLVTRMAQANNKSYMKLSGAFSELPPLTADVEPDVSGLVDRLQPWTDVIFDVFGANRVMFGSDWPVCNVGGGGNNVSWNRWRTVVEGILDRRGLTAAQKQGIWGQVAVKAYGIDGIGI
ncbi:hypothetical protein N7462_006217 [Penicillium macrosclerotiorum]|uniref:uncharacterized protein n=1 Tax=Penicillium macrosclerotiorum TaxID=303699 RepID=UPI0025488FC8|nr:uncharacterized protein N7462_006217 [Penicillium macrosclerotiorum]KAJ5683052.1 hypothetical protein N7462_006217 [Penicillium macrosclerotiorum]